MRVNFISNTTFQRRLKNSETREVNKLHSQIQNLLGHTGQNILIVHDACLPVTTGSDTGIGYLYSKEGLKFLNDMKTLLGITTVEVHPQGEYNISAENRFCCPYSGSALSLGSHLIPPAELIKPEYGALLTNTEVQSLINSNTAANKDKILNWENILPFNSPNEKILKKAFERFKELPANSPLSSEFREFCRLNNDWLEPLGLYQSLLKKYKTTLKHWEEQDKNLYNPDYNNPAKQERLNRLLTKNSDDIGFYKFKQFYADKFLNKSQNELKKAGLKLTGDMLIGFSEAEAFAFPKAFMKGKEIGWGLPALDYNTILNPDSPAAKLLKRKTELFARRYSGNIRFDVAWAYLSPALEDTKTGDIERRRLNTDALLKMIEDTIREVTGNKYSEKNLLYEFEASEEDFILDNEYRNFIKKRTKVYSMQYMDKHWGYLDGFVNHQCFTPEYLVAGLGNQDVLPIKNFAEIKDVDFSKLTKEESVNILWNVFGGDIKQFNYKDNVEFYIQKYTKLYKKKKAQIKILSNTYNIPEETLLNSPEKFAQAKAAEAFAGKNTMYYFTDVLGRNIVFDADRLNGYENYRYRIQPNYIDEYTRAVSEGFGINMFDIYEKRFKLMGLDIKYPELFKKIQKYKKIIQDTNQPKTCINKYISIVGCGIIFAALLFLGIKNTKKQPAKNKPAVING